MNIGDLIQNVDTLRDGIRKLSREKCRLDEELTATRDKLAATEADLEKNRSFDLWVQRHLTVCPGCSHSCHDTRKVTTSPPTPGPYTPGHYTVHLDLSGGELTATSPWTGRLNLGPFASAEDANLIGNLVADAIRKQTGTGVYLSTSRQTYLHRG